MQSLLAGRTYGGFLPNSYGSRHCTPTRRPRLRICMSKGPEDGTSGGMHLIRPPVSIHGTKRDCVCRDRTAYEELIFGLTEVRL
jgi:hypothetical protein